MKILIVEDEKLAFERLKTILSKFKPDIESLKHAQSVQQAVESFKNTTFDLAFFDIELADGLSFDIFEEAEIDCPIIFTTAYNQYAIQAFKHNSIDYLLKPIDKTSLNNALDKYDKLWKPKADNNIKLLIEDFKSLMGQTYKSRFVIKIGERIKLIETKDFKLVFSRDKASYVLTDREILLDYSLDKMQELLPPERFFRINRKHLVAINAIKDIISYSNSRLKVVLEKPFEDELIVSREKVSTFKLWLEGELKN
jgi:DNA-binding LytR/AlgR family response regulator